MCDKGQRQTLTEAILELFGPIDSIVPGEESAGIMLSIDDNPVEHHHTKSVDAIIYSSLLNAICISLSEIDTNVLMLENPCEPVDISDLTSDIDSRVDNIVKIILQSTSLVLFSEEDSVLDSVYNLRSVACDTHDPLEFGSHIKKTPPHHRWLGHSNRPGREGRKGKLDRKNMWSKKK